MPITVNCPTCGKALAWLPENRFRPFCCERCKLIDFGAWAREEHVIPSHGELAEGIPEGSHAEPDGS